MGRGTFEHIFSNLEPATVYSIHLRAYSAEGASQDCLHPRLHHGQQCVTALQHCRAPGLGQQGLPRGSPVPSAAPAALGFSTEVLSASSVQASWELPPQWGPIQGFKLFHHKLPAVHFQGPLLLASSVSFFLYTDLDEALNLLGHPLDPLLSVFLPQALSFLPRKACSLHNLLLPAEPGAPYEIKLQAFNSSGDGDSSARFVSLPDMPLATTGE